MALHKKEHKVLIVPGLGDGTSWLEWMTKKWNKKYGFQTEPYVMPWQGPEQDFQRKLKRFLSKIDSLTKEGQHVSLIGISAGGSAVLNAFNLRQDSIYKVVNVCGRLRSGIDVYPILEKAGRKSDSFIESVQMFEQNANLLERNSKKNVLTIYPIYDEIVPVSTMTIEGACNMQIISVEHILNIAAAMTIYSSNIINHLNSDN